MGEALLQMHEYDSDGIETSQSSHTSTCQPRDVTPSLVLQPQRSQPSLVPTVVLESRDSGPSSRRHGRGRAKGIKEWVTQEIEQRLTVEIEQRVIEKLKVEFEQIRVWMDFIRSQGGPSGIQLPNASSGRQQVRESVGDHDSQDDELLGSPVQVLHED
ncbi:hypothetical protein LOK49_LG09G01039 [Camellia lanceoleosa]|uniref:Uncharacterized protein n=1 Tax=Camellia lanceoleosa TaxID=1840588 RepID=A0ACC0GK72_9ERIC|nr:hypothetical protein LOK49_LG09G01039 [Camellia lanceoleosa]